MQLIFALGNPGKDYLWTRHNFGHLALDFHAKLQKAPAWSEKPRFHALTTQLGDTILAKSTLYYNESGLTLRALVDFYKIPLSSVLVVCDDFNLPFGTIRRREQGSAGGSNGLASVISHLSTTTFPRLRLGTDSPLRTKIGDKDFVLSRFTPEEKSHLPPLLKKVSDELRGKTS